MTAHESRMLGIAVAAAAALVVFHLAPSATPRDDDSSAAQRATREHELQEAVRQARARLERGAYVHTRKRISDTEEVQVLIVPEARADALDTRCIIYTNSELKTSSITCNGPTWHNAGGAS